MHIVLILIVVVNFINLLNYNLHGYIIILIIIVN